MRKRIALTAALLVLVGIGLGVAQEISVTTVLGVDQGNFKYERRIQNYKADKTGDGSSMGVQAATTNSAVLTLHPDVLTAGYSIFRNLSTNNSITLTVNILLKTNDVALFRPASTNILINSAAGTPNLEFWVNEE